jgi:hypothetical protein
MVGLEICSISNLPLLTINDTAGDLVLPAFLNKLIFLVDCLAKPGLTSGKT